MRNSGCGPFSLPAMFSSPKSRQRQQRLNSPGGQSSGRNGKSEHGPSSQGSCGFGPSNEHRQICRDGGIGGLADLAALAVSKERESIHFLTFTFFTKEDRHQPCPGTGIVTTAKCRESPGASGAKRVIAVRLINGAKIEETQRTFR